MGKSFAPRADPPRAGPAGPARVGAAGAGERRARRGEPREHRSPFIASVLPSLMPDTANLRLGSSSPRHQLHAVAAAGAGRASSSAAAGGAPWGAPQDVVALRGMEFFAHHGVLPEVRPAALPAAARPPPPPAPRPRVG